MSSSVSRKPRVAIIGFFHESNTFIPVPTTLESYKRDTFLIKEEVREKYGNAHHEIAGFLQTLDAADFEAVPLLFAHTSPWGKIDDETLDTVWGMISNLLDEAGTLDGVLVAPHGAAVNESRHDMDGWWIGKVREKVGSIPIISTMDPHGNLSSYMVSVCDAIIAYRENPHLDMRQRGIEAATLMIRTLRGEIKPTVAAALPPIAINIERQLTRIEPMLTIHREIDKTRALPGVLSASLVLGFPYADIADMGSGFIVVTDNDPALAQCEADRLGKWLIDNRELFRGDLISPEEAVARIENSPKPVGLLDMGDNVGGGAPGDSTVLSRLLEESGKFRSVAYFWEPEAVKLAEAAGVGGRVTLEVGGKLPMTPAAPLKVDATVVSFHDGIWTESQPRHGGKTGGNMGRCAVVKTDRGLTLLLTTRRAAAASAQPLYSCGIDPAQYDVIVLRGVHAPVGAYADICPTLIRVNTPGVTTADMVSLPFNNRRKPLFPFEEL